MEDEEGVRVMGMRITSEVRLSEVILALGVLGGGLLWWGDVNGQFAMMKQAQAAQADQGRRLESSFQEVKQDVKETRESVHGLERRMDRARM